MLKKSSWFFLPVTVLVAIIVFANKYQVNLTKDVTNSLDSPAVIKSGEDDSGNSLPGNFLASRFAEQVYDHARAIGFARKSLAEDPSNPLLKQQLYHLLLINGEIDEAIRMTLAEKLAIKHRSLSVEMLLAVRDVKQQNFADAVKRLEGANSNSLNAIMAPITQTWAKIGAGQMKVPVNTTMMMKGNAKVDAPFIQYHLALMNDVLGFSKEAATYYDSATKNLDKVPFRIVELAINFYQRSGDQESARRLIDAYKVKNPTLPFTVADAGSKEVAPIVRNASDGIAELLYSMGSVLYGVNAIEDETIYLQLALYIHPELSVAYYLLGNGYEATKQFKLAQAAYKKINPQSPLYLRGLLRSAQMEQEQGNIEQALLQIDKIIEQYPQEHDALLSKGDMLRNVNRFDEAAKAYSVVIDALKKPKRENWPTFYARGIAYERAGKWEKAEKDFHAALSLEPNQPDVMNYLGYSWLTMNKNVFQAKELIEKALDLRPDDVHIIDSMGFALYTFGEFERALEYYEQAIELAPADATVNDHLGDVYWRLGRKKEAQFQWERALLFKPDPALEKSIHEKLNNGMPVFIPPKKQPTPEENNSRTQ